MGCGDAAAGALKPSCRWSREGNPKAPFLATHFLRKAPAFSLGHVIGRLVLNNPGIAFRVAQKLERTCERTDDTGKSFPIAAGLCTSASQTARTADQLQRRRVIAATSKTPPSRRVPVGTAPRPSRAAWVTSCPAGYRRCPRGRCAAPSPVQSPARLRPPRLCA